MQVDQKVRLIRFPSFTDERGTLSVIDWPQQLPFVPLRFYYIYGAAPGVRRAGHAHWQEIEALVTLCGRVTVLTDDGRGRVEHRLDRRDQALLIPPGVWHELYDFAPETVCGVFASGHYRTEDCCRDYSEFCQRAGERTATHPVP